MQLCLRPAISMLLQRHAASNVQYKDLSFDVFPSMPTEFTMTFNGNVKIKTRQLPLAPVFALTEYKVQGATFKKAVLDLRRPAKHKTQKKEDWNH